MTPQELKNSILQLAIQGKLVEQRPEEGTAEELYQQIQAEKQRLIKARTIIKDKPLLEISDDEKTFDIPEGWKWCRLGELSTLIRGITFPGTEKSREPLKGCIRCATTGSVQSSYNERADVFVPAKYIKNTMQWLENEDIILSTANSKELVGKSCLWFGNDKMTFGGFLTVARFPDLLFRKYLYYVIQYLHKSGIFAKASTQTTNIANINNDILSKMLISLPPLAEQKRIVAKIEELLPYIDLYEQAWSKLEEFNKCFPTDLQKSILQMAIQGKLVDQRLEEGTGEELYLKLCSEIDGLVKLKKFKGKKYPLLTEDELPFDIPDTWKWVRLGDIISIESGKGLTSAQMVEGPIPVYGGNGITGYHKEALIHEETVVIGRVGFYCGSIHITEQESWVTDNAFITTYPQNSLDRNFLVYMLRHMNLGRDNNATAQPVVSGKKIYPLAFPLPPLAEQKRIVARIEKLLPLCEKLNAVSGCK